MTRAADNRRADQEAEAWLIRLSEKSISLASVQAFSLWFRDLRHSDAYHAAERRARKREAAVRALEDRH